MKKLIAGALTVGLVILLAMLFIGSATVRFNLITVSPAFWLYTLGIIFVLGGGWLITAKVPAGKMFASLGAVMLLLGGYKSIWPNTSAATSHAQEVADLRAALALNETVAPKAIRCDRESGTQFWDRVVKNKPIVFYALNKNTHRIDCFDRNGFDGVSGQEYKEVSAEIIEIILNQDPPQETVAYVPSVPVATPQPVRVVEAPAPVPVIVQPVATIPIAKPVVQATPEPVVAVATALAAPARRTATPVADILSSMRTTPARQTVSEPDIVAVTKKTNGFSAMRGQPFTVALTEPLDLGERGENFQFTGMLTSDVSDNDGVVLAPSGTPVGLMISRLQLDPRSHAVHLELVVTSLTTSGGTPLPVSARYEGPLIVKSVKSGMKGNALKGALIGAAGGAIVGALADGKRGAVRGGAIGTAAGAGAGVVLTKGQYILSPRQLEMTFQQRWAVPAVMLASAK